MWKQLISRQWSPAAKKHMLLLLLAFLLWLTDPHILISSKYGDWQSGRATIYCSWLTMTGSVSHTRHVYKRMTDRRCHGLLLF